MLSHFIISHKCERIKSNNFVRDIKKKFEKSKIKYKNRIMRVASNIPENPSTRITNLEFKKLLLNICVY